MTRPVRRPPMDSMIEMRHWASAAVAVVSVCCEHPESLFVQLTSPVSSAQWLCSDYRIHFGRHSVEKKTFVSSIPIVGTSTIDISVAIRIIVEGARENESDETKSRRENAWTLPVT